ncbi:hypothetical protein [Nocardia vaccinii]|uniref:hypothetical protein n=1 Tax=Nocardia vaccinii TaxID=1822 RepID=UPI000AF96727|nr:hypothetical protein [Nocardia vaccinii]
MSDLPDRAREFARIYTDHAVLSPGGKQELRQLLNDLADELERLYSDDAGARRRQMGARLEQRGARTLGRRLARNIRDGNTVDYDDLGLSEDELNVVLNEEGRG